MRVGNPSIASFYFIFDINSYIRWNDEVQLLRNYYNSYYNLRILLHHSPKFEVFVFCSNHWSRMQLLISRLPNVKKYLSIRICKYFLYWAKMWNCQKTNWAETEVMVIMQIEWIIEYWNISVIVIAIKTVDFRGTQYNTES